MKITITYWKDSSLSNLTSYWAKTEVVGGSLAACGENWEDAKKRLLDKVSEHLAIQRGEIEIPADEEVEV